jgi:hypothetical protein
MHLDNLPPDHTLGHKIYSIRSLIERNIGLKKFKCNRIILNGIRNFHRGPRKLFSEDIPKISNKKKNVCPNDLTCIARDNFFYQKPNRDRFVTSDAHVLQVV